MIAASPHPRQRTKPPVSVFRELAHTSRTRSAGSRVLESTIIAGAPAAEADLTEQNAVPLIVLSSAREPVEAVNSILRRAGQPVRSEEHTSELQSRLHLVCRLLLEK